MTQVSIPATLVYDQTDLSPITLNTNFPSTQLIAAKGKYSFVKFRTHDQVWPVLISQNGGPFKSYQGFIDVRLDGSGDIVAALPINAPATIMEVSLFVLNTDATPGSSTDIPAAIGSPTYDAATGQISLIPIGSSNIALTWNADGSLNTVSDGTYTLTAAWDAVTGDFAGAALS